ncbi:hypothetical protein PanWU01x14_028530 [Parasponia andersonii]|uniref:Uncharacterized protein n=1 Tax=Parasponia andersonii TaxID=3476 RepID=A0A2P5DVA7_PARAD|nr:hypothetical protein PanWU01x14_028530 [Parasponia andersonii]
MKQDEPDKADVEDVLPPERSTRGGEPCDQYFVLGVWLSLKNIITFTLGYSLRPCNEGYFKIRSAEEKKNGENVNKRLNRLLKI